MITKREREGNKGRKEGDSKARLAGDAVVDDDGERCRQNDWRLYGPGD